MKQRQENADRQQRRDRIILSVHGKGMEFENERKGKTES